jgi:phenol/toluene 2-monooxygenase (NADH) P0/A0
MVEGVHLSDEGFDPGRRYVRVRRVRDDGFVEFEFAIGDPDMFVEMILPQQALAGFCAANDVILLDDLPETADASTDAERPWTLDDATQRRFRTPLRSDD